MNLYLNLDLDVVFFQAILYLLNSDCQAGIRVMQMREEQEKHNRRQDDLHQSTV